MTDEEKDNVFKISVPIITNEELERLDYTIKNDLDNIVHQISKTVSRDRDIIILKKVIEKQSKEIEEYKKQLDLDYVDRHFVPIERYNQLKDKNKKLQDKAKELIFEKQELTSALLDSTPKDKIKAKIEEVDKDENASIPDFIEYAKEYATQKLQSLLEKE